MVLGDFYHSIFSGILCDVSDFSESEAAGRSVDERLLQKAGFTLAVPGIDFFLCLCAVPARLEMHTKGTRACRYAPLLRLLPNPD